MKNNNWLILGLLVCNILGTCYVLHRLNDCNESKVVDLVELYTNFRMTEEINQKYMNASVSRLERLDTLETNLGYLEKELSLTKEKSRITQIHSNIGKLQREYQELSQINNQIKVEMEQQIWNQLNNYLLDFGEESSYPLIFGSKKQGELLYIEPARNITQEALEFVNNKYLGKS